MSTNALMTSKNSPIVRTVSGKVKKINRGLTMALAKPRSRAATSNDPPSANRKPLKR